MRQTIVVLSRQKPHLVLFLVLSILSGVAYLTGSPDATPGQGDLPPYVSAVWAWALLVTGSLGVAGILWQRWYVLRGMYLERSALLLQASGVTVYAGFLSAYQPDDWLISAVAGGVWAVINVWEARLIKRDLGMIEGVTG